MACIIVDDRSLAIERALGYLAFLPQQGIGVPYEG